MLKKDVLEKDRELIRKHWKTEAVFTDAWRPGADERKVPEEELLPGELSAVVFQVGCYTVRSAQRVYRIHGPEYAPELETPADNEEVEMVRKDLETGVEMRKEADCEAAAWDEKLRVTNEISARHNSDPNTEFIYICRAAETRNASWYEYIGDIYVVKDNAHIPDEYASLLVYSHYEGRSFGFDMWYKFGPTGKLTVLRPGTDGILSDEAGFE